MANSAHQNKLSLNGGYGGQVLNRLKTGNRWAMPYLPEIWEVLISYADHDAAASTTDTLVLNTHAGAGKEFPADVEIIGVQVYVHTTLDGGATTEGTIQIGDTGDPNGLTTALSIHEDGTGATGWQSLTWGAEFGTVSRPEAAYEPNVLLTTTSADTDVLTSGLYTVRIKYIPLHIPRAS